MKQVSRVLLNYSADLFGICSALYELGGLTVMHDASGCNSTYNTHDEPRWYDRDSLIYVSGLCESDAILGNDDKLIEDVCEVADEEHPRFIALCGSPIPLIMGTDYRGIARVVEKRTGIPSFGIQTSGMQTYVRGGGAALAEIVRRFCPSVPAASEKTASGRSSRFLHTSRSGSIRINLIGVTPLDFSVTGNVEALGAWFRNRGCTIVSTWAMGNTLDQLTQASIADVNVVVSSLGLPAAQALQQLYGTPFVTGIPVGIHAADRLLAAVSQYAPEAEWLHSVPEDGSCGGFSGCEPVWIIGEPVFAASLRACLEQDLGIRGVRIICPVEEDAGVLRQTDVRTDEEDAITALLNTAGTVIADPVYRRVLPAGSNVRFVDFPHIAYSGRMYRNDVPVFIGGGIVQWLSDRM